MTVIRLSLWGFLLSAGVAAGAESGPPAPPQTNCATPPSGFRQFADELVEPFEPKTPLSEDEKARQAALKWYMTGQLREGRNDFDGALEAYRKAVEAAPQELRPYQSLVTITFAQSNRDEAMRYAVQAAQQSREGLGLVRGLAALLIRASDTQKAIDLLEEVRKSPPGDLQLVDELVLHRELGLFNRLLLKTDAAVEHYKKVMDALLDPNSTLSQEDREALLGDAGKTYEEMGKVFLDAKLADLAVQAFDEASKHSAARPGIHSFNLATVYKETDRKEEALAELQKYFDAQLQSKGREAYQLLADLLQDLNKSDELLPRLEELHDRDLRNKTLSYFLAEQYEKLDHLDEAEELLKETVGESNDPRGLVGLASVYRRQHKAKPLLETFAKAFQVVPQTDEPQVLERMDSDTRAVVERLQELQSEIAADSKAMDGLISEGQERIAGDQSKLDFVQVYVLGKLCVDAKRIEPAKQFYQLAIDMQNDPPAQLFRELGFALTDAQEYKAAAEVFQQALEHSSPRLQADGIRAFFQYLQSHALEMDGQTDAALKAIGEARKALPDNVGMQFQEAWVYYHAHRWDDAIQRFEQLIEEHKSSDDPETQRVVRNARFSLSAVYVELNNMDKGEEVLLVVLQQEPDHPQANNDLGYLWADQGKNLERAKGMIEKALAAEQDNPAYIDSMGWVLHRLGQYEQAREFLEKASNMPDGNDSTIWDHLAQTYEKLGQPEKAADAWRKALELEQEKAYPDEEFLKRVGEKVSPKNAAATR